MIFRRGVFRANNEQCECNHAIRHGVRRERRGARVGRRRLFPIYGISSVHVLYTRIPCIVLIFYNTTIRYEHVNGTRMR